MSNLNKINSSEFSPLVTIVIPVYNGGDYLNESIQSALSQTYKNIEVIVVNDGSTDSGVTRNIALSYGDMISYYEKENGGVSSALNLGIKKMNGQYFSWLSHDDLYSSEKIEKQLTYALNSHDKSDVIVYSDSINFSKISANNLSRAERYKDKSIRYFLTRVNKINGCSLLIPTAVFKKCGLFNESLLYVQDNEMWFRIAKYYEFIYLNEVLVYSRVHVNQTGNIHKPAAILEADNLKSSFIEDLVAADFGLADITWTFYLPIYWELKLSGYRLAPAAVEQRILKIEEGRNNFLKLSTLRLIDVAINLVAFFICARNNLIRMNNKGQM